MSRRRRSPFARLRSFVVSTVGLLLLAVAVVVALYPESGILTDGASADDAGADGPTVVAPLSAEALAAVEAAARAGDPATAVATVLTLDVKGRAPKTGYDREEFGPAWADVDHNGCDTSNDILARDLTDETFKPGTHDCVVLTGTLADPYSGRTIAFQRGQDTSSAVQIDHLVALSDAWQKGAQQWDDATRQAFANDPLNLLAADGPLNSQKGAGDTATWLPPSTAFRCTYVARQVAVKHTYGLWVTQAERDAMLTVLSTCPQEPLPVGAAATA